MTNFLSLIHILLKTQNVDAILHVGDIGDMCSRYAYETYLNVFHEVFPDENTRPYESVSYTHLPVGQMAVGEWGMSASGR